MYEPKLFILIDNRTNEIRPYVYVNIWEKCIKRFHDLTKENDDEYYLAQLIHKEINETTAEASMRCNRKGWGCDYFRYITIEPLVI